MSFTEPGLWHPISTDYTIVAHCDAAGHNTTWRSQAKSGKQAGQRIKLGPKEFLNE